MTAGGPLSAWEEPSSNRRIVLLIGVLAVLFSFGAVRALSPDMTAFSLLFAVTLFLFWEETIQSRARRDAFTDLSQAIHDGNVTGDDLRRVRGYEEIEKRLTRADAKGRGDDS